jgi:hypothetical protein
MLGIKNKLITLIYLICLKIYGGVILKKIILTVYFLVLASITIIRLKAFVLILNAISFRHTPLFIIAIPIITIIFMSVLSGFENILKVSGYFFIFTLLICCFIFFILITSFDIVNYTPILGNGIDKIFLNMPIVSSIFTPLVFLLFFKNNNLDYNGTKKIIFLSIILNFILIFILTTGVYNVLYGHILEDFNYPLYQSLAITNVNEYSDGFEIILSYICFFITLLHISFLTYLTCDLGNRVIPKFKFKSFSIVVIILIYLLFFLNNEIIQPPVLSNILRYFTFSIVIPIPFIISLIYLFKKKIVKKEE